MSTFTPPTLPPAMSTDSHAAMRGAALRNRFYDVIAEANADRPIGSRWTWSYSGFGNPQYVGDWCTAYVYASADGTRYVIRLLDTYGSGEWIVSFAVTGPRAALRTAQTLADLTPPDGVRLAVTRLGALVVVAEALTREVESYAMQVRAGHLVVLPDGAAWLAANVDGAPLEVQA